MIALTRRSLTIKMKVPMNSDKNSFTQGVVIRSLSIEGSAVSTLLDENL